MFIFLRYLNLPSNQVTVKMIEKKRNLTLLSDFKIVYYCHHFIFCQIKAALLDRMWSESKEKR